MVGETKCFQDKCLLHNLREAEMDYRDIIYMLDKDIVVQERQGKHERICHMTNLQEIASNAEVAVTKAEQALQLVKGKNGRKDFWKKILLNGKEVEGKITSVKNKCERLLQMFDDVLGPGRKEQATRRESKKNQKNIETRINHQYCTLFQKACRLYCTSLMW